MQNEVCINIQRLIHRALQSIQIDQSPVETGAGSEVGAERFQFFANSQRVARRSAFLQHALLKVGGASRVGRIGGVSAVHHQSEIHHGSGVALRQHNLQPVAERGFLKRRKLERHGVARSGLSRPVEFGFSFEAGGIRMHFEHVVAVAQPVVGSLLHRGRSRGLHAFKIVLIAIGIAEETLAARQQVALATEAANAFDDPRIGSQDLCLCQLQLGSGGSVLEEILQFLVRGLFNFTQISTGSRGEGEIELPADLIRRVRRGRTGRDLIFVDQALVKS